jgi:hypothetical protein
VAPPPAVAPPEPNKSDSFEPPQANAINDDTKSALNQTRFIGFLPRDEFATNRVASHRPSIDFATAP